tara:strand:+ start:689 stop:907 length:219 start_codon:yes stop_codon:yes gene_type:complete
MIKFNEIRASKAEPIVEASQRFVFDTSMKMKKGEKLAKKFDLKVDTEKQMGLFFIAVSGDINNIVKWMKAVG